MFFLLSFCSFPIFFLSYSFSKADSPIETEILSKRAITPKPTNYHDLSFPLVPVHVYIQLYKALFYSIIFKFASCSGSE